MAKPNSLEDRITKLLTLAKSDPTSPEGQTAMRKALLWLAKANLSLEEFESREEGDKIGELMWTDFINRPWARTIASNICRLYFCRVLFFVSPKSKKIKASVIGTKSNSQVAFQISLWVLDCINKKARGEFDSTKSQNSFRAAAALAIKDQVMTIMGEEKKTKIGDGTGTSLVLASVYNQELSKVSDYLNSTYTNTKALSNRSKLSDSIAAAAGYAYGQTIRLNKQIS